MVKKGILVCPVCSGRLRYFDHTKRILRTKNRRTTWIRINRLKCLSCGRIHRELPNNIYPYKQYEAEVIQGVIEGLITCETLGYEDYPCEMTMHRWISQKHFFIENVVHQHN